MKRFLLALMLGAMLLVPTSAFAYSYTFSCGPSWSNLPVSYWINSNGSADVPFSTVENIMEDSFAVWGDPCCSNFAANYRGTTSLTATNNQNRVVLSWVENSWNPQWGSVNQTIGITFSSVFNNCSIATAPILFNGVGFRFTTNGSGTDLQSIATHEIGHLLGLGHSNLQSATMYAAYVGGTGARTLHQDDIDGVCSLYTTSCSCTSPSQCASNEDCIGGQCRIPPCGSDADCDVGLSCNQGTGECEIPPCGNDADCSAGFECQNSVCVSGCPVCRRNCSSDADCGSGGQCIENGDGSTVCIVFCGQNAACPGNAECYQVQSQGETFFVCGSPDPNSTSICPDNYVCQDGGVVNTCASDAECSNNQVCRNTVNGMACVDDDDPCADVMCGDGLYCDNGICYREDISNNVPGNNTPGNNNPGNNTPGNNTPGNNDNNTPGNNDNGGNNNTDEEPFIIVKANDEGTEETGCCAVTSPREVPGTLLLLVGLLAFVRRRR